MVEKQEVTAGQRITIGQVTVVPVVRTTVCGDNKGSGFTVFGAREVLGIMVASPDGVRAIDISGEEVPIEKYLRQVPQLAEVLGI